VHNAAASAVKAALTWLEAYDFKTLDFFIRVLMTWVSDLYSGNVAEAEFVDRLADLIDQQLTRAWNEGMRANGLDPFTDLDPECAAELQDIIANEYLFVDQFAADIIAGRGGGINEFQRRASLWGNRYTDTTNRAKLCTADAKSKLMWRMGATEEHCPTCSRLDGVVAYAREWEAAGIRPQSPPNGNLDCKGWNCKCELVPTKQRRSPKALDILLNIGIRL
jgi:hypothetical protein